MFDVPLILDVLPGLALNQQDIRGQSLFELLHAVVHGIRHVNEVTRRVDGNTRRLLELAVAITERTPLRDIIASTREFLNPVVGLVHHVDITVAINGNISVSRQLK